jgi:hypothetical protein
VKYSPASPALKACQATIARIANAAAKIVHGASVCGSMRTITAITNNRIGATYEA